MFFIFSCFSFLFVFPFFLFFLTCFCFFQLFEQTLKPGINRREVLIVKMTFFFCEKSIFGPRMERGKMRNGPFEGNFTFMFFISLFIFSIVCFSYKKCSSFFSGFLFNKVSLLAIEAEFDCRCLLRSRCSMEMWYPDDIGRDNWDRVGSPTWERA